ncbi:endospore germination permease [Paenibacillus turpanensis]|uniref:endospore germination permease n=1 Tax=Paenibacillus turpanensis TaxID=2689078 RepID=UPI00140BB11A
MNKSELTRYQSVLIAAGFTLNATLISLPSVLTKYADGNFWFSYLLAYFYGIAVVYFISKTASRFPGKDLFVSLIEWRAWAGKAVVLLYTGFYLFILIRDLRSTVDFIEISLLNHTPLPMIMVLLIATTVIAAAGKPMTFARMNELWQPFLLFIIVLLPVFLLGDIDFKYLFPVFEKGLLPPLQASWYLIPYLGEAIGLAFIANSQSWMPRAAVIGVTIGTGALFILQATVILTLGTELPSRLLYPNYEMIRQISLTDFLDRFDLPIVGIWLPAMMVKISFSLYIVSHGLGRIFSPKREKLMVFVLGLISGILALYLFRDALQVFALNYVWVPFAVVLQLGLPLLMFMFVRPRKADKPGPKNEDKSQQNKDKQNKEQQNQDQQDQENQQQGEQQQQGNQEQDQQNQHTQNNQEQQGQEQQNQDQEQQNQDQQDQTQNKKGQRKSKQKSHLPKNQAETTQNQSGSNNNL